MALGQLGQVCTFCKPQTGFHFSLPPSCQNTTPLGSKLHSPNHLLRLFLTSISRETNFTRQFMYLRYKFRRLFDKTKLYSTKLCNSGRLCTDIRSRHTTLRQSEQPSTLQVLESLQQDQSMIADILSTTKDRSISLNHHNDKKSHLDTPMSKSQSVGDIAEVSEKTLWETPFRQ